MDFKKQVDYLFDNMGEIVDKILLNFPVMDPSINKPLYVLFYTLSAKRHWYGNSFSSVNSFGLQDKIIVPLAEYEPFLANYRFCFDIKVNYDKDGEYFIKLDNLNVINPIFHCNLIDNNQTDRIDIVKKYLLDTLQPYFESMSTIQ
jgi:hypothetical protein